MHSVAIDFLKVRFKPMISSYYGLNKSYGKKILTGLEVNEDGPEKWFSIVIRFLGNDHTGLSISPDGWQEMKNLFPIIQEDFSTNNVAPYIESRSTKDFLLRFTYSHFDKAIEISENLTSYHHHEKKAFRKGIVFKKITFDTLRRLTPVIDDKIAYLREICNSVGELYEKIPTFIIGKMEENNNGHKIESVNLSQLDELVDGMTPADFSFIATMISIFDENGFMDMGLLKQVFYELYSINLTFLMFHLNNVIEYFKKNN